MGLVMKAVLSQKLHDKVTDIR